MVPRFPDPAPRRSTSNGPRRRLGQNTPRASVLCSGSARPLPAACRWGRRRQTACLAAIRSPPECQSGAAAFRFRLGGMLKKTARNFRPLRMASSMMRRPSMAQYPSGVSSAWEKARRSSFTRALWRPSMRRSRAFRVRSPVAVVSFIFLQFAQNHTCSSRLYALSHVMFTFRDFDNSHGKGPVRARRNSQDQCEKPEASLIRYAADQIRAGEVLGMPTDTFYGLAADPFNLRAVDRVYDIKSRSRHKPLSLLIETWTRPNSWRRTCPKSFTPGAPILAGAADHYREGRSAAAAESDGQHRQRRPARPTARFRWRWCRPRKFPSLRPPPT